MSASKIFNTMVNTYDEIQELWYAWLFSRLHFIVAKEIIKKYNPKTVLDVGCGTGFQSFLHATVGASVVGIDITEGLVKVATQKSMNFKPEKRINLFPSYYDFVEKYNQLIGALLSKEIAGNQYKQPSFQIADARYLPFVNESYDHINCCGSTLCFIKDHQLAISEIARVLKPGGTVLLEGDSRWNLDLFWSALDASLKSRWGYDKPFFKAIRAIFAPLTDYIINRYPLDQPEDQRCNIKAFTAKGLKLELAKYNLKVVKNWTIHSITNFIPSTYLDMSDPPKWLKILFKSFANIEERIPFALPGLSMVFLAIKEKK
jgi:ubiquinone/menaquinone biosynthesis C-methylase UbiE